MTGGMVFLLLVLLAVLGHTRLGIRGEYTRQRVGAWIRMGPVRWQLYPWRTHAQKKKPEAEKKSASSVPEKKPILSPYGVFRLVQRLIPVAWKGAGAVRRRMQVDTLQIEVQVGAPDPAEAAEQYGKVNALLGAVWGPITQAFHVQNGRAHVEVDFSKKEPTLYGVLELSLTVRQLLWLGLRYGPMCLKIFWEVRKQDKAAETRRRKAA